jgi:hypothetical protein
MTDAGVGEVELPAAGPVGTIEYLLMDEDEQVHVGNMGSCMVMKRWHPPAGKDAALRLRLLLGLALLPVWQ